MVELFLLVGDVGRSPAHQVSTLGTLGERDDVSNGAGLGKYFDQSVQALGDAGGMNRRCPTGGAA